MDQMDLMASYSKVAELAHRVEQCEPEAMAIALGKNGRAADLERNIQSGAYARMMRDHLKCTEECLDNVKRLLAGTFPQTDSLSVASRHRSGEMLRRLPKAVIVEDILMIPTYCRQGVFCPPANVDETQIHQIHDQG